jgi:hypothetical protein
MPMTESSSVPGSNEGNGCYCTDATDALLDGEPSKWLKPERRCVGAA